MVPRFGLGFAFAAPAAIGACCRSGLMRVSFEKKMERAPDDGERRSLLRAIIAYRSAFFGGRGGFSAVNY